MIVFETLEDKGEAKEYKKGKDVSTKYFQPKVNSELEVKFKQAEWHPGESMDTFYARLYSLASNCSFTDSDKEIKSQTIQSCMFIYLFIWGFTSLSTLYMSYHNG